MVWWTAIAHCAVECLLQTRIANCCPRTWEYLRSPEKQHMVDYCSHDTTQRNTPMIICITHSFPLILGMNRNKAIVVFCHAAVIQWITSRCIYIKSTSACLSWLCNDRYIHHVCAALSVKLFVWHNNTDMQFCKITVLFIYLQVFNQLVYSMTIFLCRKTRQRKFIYMYALCET